MSTAEAETERPLEDIFADFAPGPLTEYRSRSSFDWKKMKIFLDGGEYMARYKESINSSMEKHPVLYTKPKPMPSLDEMRHLTTQRLKILKQLNIFTADSIINEPHKTAAGCEAVGYCEVGPSGKMLVMQMFIEALHNFGSERHACILDQAKRDAIQGCFALTEVAHGSNVKGMCTAASYHPHTREFVMHTPDFRAAKCWMGHLGKCATHAIVFAKLFMPSGKNMGLHPFVVPIRDPDTMKTYPGVTVGDLGEKVGMNGIDNGFLMFHMYRIPKECLLDKYGDVDEEGVYHSIIEDDTKRLVTILGTVSKSRAYIPILAASQLLKAITIAVRYSSVRKQFGPEDSDVEYPVIEYQLQQIRILPYLAAGIASRVFANWLVCSYGEFLSDKNSGSNSVRTLLLEMEFHAVTSATKPMITWLARDGIQRCRDACGGHGYLKVAGIGELYNDCDANCTYEGENNVLLQQAGNWLLYLWKKVQLEQTIASPMGTADFLNNHQTILKSKPMEHCVQNTEDILSAFRWLICYLLSITGKKILKLLKSGEGMFDAKNNSQAYYAATLSIAYAQYTMMKVFCEFVKKCDDQSVRRVLEKLILLLGSWQLEQHMGFLYMGKYFTGNMGHILHEFVIKQCKELKNEAVSVVDSIAPPDFLLDSPLGKSDGNVYERLQTELFSNPDVFSRPSWWKDISLVDNDTTLQSKL